MTKTAAAEKPEIPYAIWDTLAITESQAEYLLELAEIENRNLSKEAAFLDAQKDTDLYDFEWQDLCEHLTALMQRINPDKRDWTACVENFGWRNLSGHKEFRADDGKKLLEEILPKTDCTFKIFDRKDHIALQNFHHDSPTGNEWYRIEPTKEGEER